MPGIGTVAKADAKIADNEGECDVSGRVSRVSE